MALPVCRKATPVLFVETLAPSLAFWRDRLGFAITTEVPGEDGPAFAILAGNGIELMLQTTASLAADPHAAAMDWRGDRSSLFIEVDDIDALAAALDGCEVVAPRHDTFYGATEIAYREPGGHFVTFAAFEGRDA
ncbi:VOC family protein [Rhodanobacter caeni]|jgi:catechol 2,3-dioxygenase-like lactoylglutathione lyase family enzyme|uniref:VOC domain-containing protein n=1 Tax=Rhodanobacter caeni TaxID=657654 RepID=A0ABP3EI88_9GAMM